MKPKLEKIEPLFGNSFTIREFANQSRNVEPNWHFHPEYEIVYISNGRGKRHIANHISYYEEGDLIFLGPDLPHLGFSEESDEEHREIVVQMREDFLGRDFLRLPECRDLQQLFERSRRGISFFGKTRKWAGQQLQAMMSQDPFTRMLTLLQLLQRLAKTDEYQLLQVDGFALEVNAQHLDRVQAIYGYVGQHFQEEITLETIAGRVNMTVPAFCRYFKRLTGKTFTQFINEVRIAHSCRLLADEHLSISAVSYDSGYNNLSHFNKQFRLITGTSPREFRQGLKKIVDQPNAED